MPMLATLQAFADTVESNDHVGAIEKFYAPDAITRENDAAPIVGRDALAEKERRVVAIRVHRQGWIEARDGGGGVADLARRETDRRAVFLRSRDDEKSVQPHCCDRIGESCHRKSHLQCHRKRQDASC
jgi:hypothetical protein